MRVYKILSRAEWDAAVAVGHFAGSAVDLKDGFIHLSTAEQAGETAHKHFGGQTGLVIVGFEAEALDLTWEPSRGGALFPHLYGPLPTASAVSVDEAPLGPDGAPVLPPLAP